VRLDTSSILSQRDSTLLTGLYNKLKALVLWATEDQNRILGYSEYTTMQEAEPFARQLPPSRGSMEPTLSVYCFVQGVARFGGMRWLSHKVIAASHSNRSIGMYAADMKKD
jgi:hypothetical protein